MRICHVNIACIQHWFCRIFSSGSSECPRSEAARRREGCAPVLCGFYPHNTTQISVGEENCGTALSCSSPVLWVNKAGVYKCIVKDAEESMECCSIEISVSGMY